MFSLITLILIVTLSILITRIATIALNHTGLSRQIAAFQARSAFTGVGFTTSEAETVVNHPVRRKIIMTLMLIGNAGIISVMATLILTFMNAGNEATQWPLKLAILAGSIIILWLLSNSRWVDRWLSRVISKALKRYTTLYVHDYASLLHFSENYQLYEYHVKKEDWMTHRELADIELKDEGINLIGITRDDNTYIGTPKGDTKIEVGDILLLYGRKACFRSLTQRKRGAEGDEEHRKAIAAQKEYLHKQEIKDKYHPAKA